MSVEGASLRSRETKAFTGVLVVRGSAYRFTPRECGLAEGPSHINKSTSCRHQRPRRLFSAPLSKATELTPSVLRSGVHARSVRT